LERATRQLEALRRGRRYGPGLRVQMLVALALILLAMILFVGLIVLGVNRGSLERQKVRHVVAQGELLAQATSTVLDLEEPLDAPKNRTQLRRLLQASAGRAGVSQVVVMDAGPRLVAAVPPDIGTDLGPGAVVVAALMEQSPQWRILSDGRGGREVVAWAPLARRGGEAVGVVGLRASLRDVDALIQRNEQLILLNLVLQGLVQLAVGYVLMTRLVVRPLQTVGAATHRVAQGDYQAGQVEVQASNELGRLADDFNAMVRQLQAQRLQTEEQLEQLQEANEELAQAQQSLIRSEKLATVGTLAAGVAHEVGNPLAAVLGYVELLRDGGLDPDDARDLLKRTEQELARIDRTIRELLDYARVKQAQQALQPLGPSVDSAVQLVRGQPRLRGVEIECALPADLPWVWIDEGRLQQVLVNLLLNAADAMPEGASKRRITLSAKTELVPTRPARRPTGSQAPDAEGRPGRLSTSELGGGLGSEAGSQARPARRPTGEAERAFVVLEITDTGPGIAPEVLPKIFEPFFTTKNPGKGTGLGLAISQSIMASLGGELSVRSQVGQGATFALRLRCRPDERAMPREALGAL
jgi:signal transduction histidine kinase